MKKRNSLIITVSVLILFIIGYYLSATFVHKPLSDSQLDYYEEIALNVFEKTVGNVTIETDEVIVNKTPSTITVSPKYGYVGFVKATLENENYFLAVVLNETEEPSDDYVVLKEKLDNDKQYVIKVEDANTLAKLVNLFTISLSNSVYGIGESAI